VRGTRSASLDGLALRVDRARPVVIPGEADHTLLLHGFQDLVADRAVEDRVHVIEGAEDEGQRGHDGLGHDVVQRRRAQADHLEAADLELLDRVALLTERRVGVDLQAQAAVAPLS